MYKIN